jgi:hypothetical protein
MSENVEVLNYKDMKKENYFKYKTLNYNGIEIKVY